MTMGECRRKKRGLKTELMSSPTLRDQGTKKQPVNETERK